MIKLPDERAKCVDEFLSEYLPQQPYYMETFNKGWNACLAEVQRLNAKLERDEGDEDKIEDSDRGDDEAFWDVDYD